MVFPYSFTEIIPKMTSKLTSAAVILRINLRSKILIRNQNSSILDETCRNTLKSGHIV